MTDSLNKALRAAVLRVLRPLIRILLRNGVSYGSFADMAKWVYVDLASSEFGIEGRKQTISRVSVITGLNRKEVSRVQALDPPDDSEAERHYNRAARVITGWLRDEQYTDDKGAPLALPFDGSAHSFSALVKQHSGDMPARAVLDELLRVGAVKRDDTGISLQARAYIPQTGEADKLHILGSDVAQLIHTIDHNLQHGEIEPRYQRKVYYDNLPDEAMPKLRELSREKSQQLLEELNDWMAKHDRDINPDSGGTGRKEASIGIYYYEHEVPEEKRDE